ncbi:retrovirus-related pol polyprotein from transposon TNT 1-94 [Tanacetum coccineum]|uniref:Retrovirus-related pol polyprotein from transposon TNT 1-94 n=1 Tax=Tanacetum coccineum TaxID=301880 RepID=A0ABQ5FE76_9ASTR
MMGGGGGVFVSQKAKSREELYFSNISKTASVSKSISIPNEVFSDDTTPSVARKFLNEVKSTIVTLQRVVKQKMTLDIHNWLSTAHRELHKIVKDEIFPIVNQVDVRLQNFEIQFLKEAAKFVQDFKSLAKEADESLAKHKTLEFEIERLLRAVVSQDIMSIVQSNSVVDTSNLQTDLDRMKEKLENCIIKKEKEYVVLRNNWTPPKVVKTNDLSNPVTSNSVPITKESDVVKNGNVIAPGIFRINPFKTSREDKFVLINQAKASIRTNPIIVSQLHVITKKDVNSDSNGLSSIGVDNTAKTKIPQPRSNTKNDRVPSASKSSCIKNKEVEVEEHHRNLLISKNKDLVSYECNNVKLVIRNDKSKVICVMYKQCLITSNHDVCVLNYENGMNSRVNNLYANVSKTTNQKKHKPTVTKPKKVGSKERLASPKPRKPRTCLRWSPTGRMFDIKGKIIESSELESQSDYSKGDNACTSNPQEPTRKRFLNSTFSLAGLLNLFMVHKLGMFKAYDRKSKASHKFCLEVLGNWHNLFSVGQFCDSDLEVAFRRNTYFVRNLKGVDLLKGNHTTNLYTINLHEMASVSPIFLMARATSTKSWLWHQHLSHLYFDTINDLAKNDLIIGLPKFKYHKEHLYPSCEQGKSKNASHPPKPVPNPKHKWETIYFGESG